MLVAIDIGNSNVVIGVFHEDEWRHIWRIPTLRTTDVNFYKLKTVELWLEAGLDMRAVAQVMISSVVPELTEAARDFCRDLFGCPVTVIGLEIYPQLDLEILRPHQIGSDLVANAFAVTRLFGQDALIVDFGTALTFTAVGEDRKLHGVSILPGIKTALRSLNVNTAKLPQVPLEFPSTVGGKDTTHAIQSGVLLGYEGLITTMIQRYRNEFSHGLITVATGGLILALEPLQQHFDHIQPALTLDGLRFMAEPN